MNVTGHCTSVSTEQIRISYHNEGASPGTSICTQKLIFLGGNCAVHTVVKWGVGRPLVKWGAGRPPLEVYEPFARAEIGIS